MRTTRNRPYTTVIPTMTVATTVHTADSTMVYAFPSSTTPFLGDPGLDTLDDITPSPLSGPRLSAFPDARVSPLIHPAHACHQRRVERLTRGWTRGGERECRLHVASHYHAPTDPLAPVV